MNKYYGKVEVIGEFENTITSIKIDKESIVIEITTTEYDEYRDTYTKNFSKVEDLEKYLIDFN